MRIQRSLFSLSITKVICNKLLGFCMFLCKLKLSTDDNDTNNMANNRWSLFEILSMCHVTDCLSMSQIVTREERTAFFVC